MNLIHDARRTVAPLLLFSMLSNLAVLISPLFMMQVLDRVVPSGNTATLLLLAALAMAALLLQGAAETVRDLSLRRLGTWVEGRGSRQVVHLAGHVPADGPSSTAGADSGGLGSASTAIAALTEALRGPVAQAALCLPWLPLFVAALALIHPGFVVLLTGLLGMLLVLDRLLTAAARGALQGMAAGQRREQALFQQAPVQGARLGTAIAAQHLLSRALSFQQQRHQQMDHLDLSQSLANSVAGVLRSAGQILALALGAYLVTQNQLSAGGMIAASLILSRSYANCEMVLKQAPALWQALADYHVVAGLDQGGAAPMELPDFEGALRAENLTCPRGGGAPPFLDRVSLTLAAGECLAIVGGAGSGKTSLLNALSGLRAAPIGSVFYDDTVQRSLGPAAAHRTIGHLPQRADLIEGSLADNIACFDPQRQDAAVIAAAQAAGVHGLISALPEGYETDLSRTPHLLSAGQVQRVALARAIYAQPRYLFLDEPNALLDGEGERALLQTLLRLKSSGTTIVMVLHRSGVMALADKILRLDQGRVADFGPRSEVLARLSGNQRRVRLPALATSQQDLRDWIAGQFTRANDAEFSQKAQIVAQELFALALESAVGAGEGAQELEFTLRFLDEFECELRMITAPELDLEEKMARVHKQMRAGKSPAPAQPRDEIALAALARMGTSLRQQRKPENTTVLASILAQNTSDVDGDRIGTGGVLQ